MPRPLAVIRDWWWSSLTTRVVIMTLVASSAVFALGGLLLLHQASDGIVASKRQSALAESQTAYDIAQSTLLSLANSPSSVDLRLTEVAVAAAQRGHVSGQYEVVLQAGAATFQPPVFDGDPIPTELRDAMAATDQLYVTPTLIRWSDSRPQDEVPGMVVGALLDTGQGSSYPIYFVFPLDNEVRTLGVLQQAVLTVGALLAGALTLVAVLVARTVVGPVRTAADTAQRLARGHLDERMPVRGSDDLAVLGTSMNDMAAELEQQIRRHEDLSRVQQQFVSDVSHELRTPLTTVRMAAEMLHDSREELGPVFGRSVELLHDELDRFEALLADLLEISRFDAGAAVLALDVVDLGDVVRAEVGAQTAFAQRMGTPLAVAVRGDVEAEVDARRIQRILRNLVTNAIEHGEHRPIEITVAGDDRAVAITVRDHGVGFEPQHAQQLFHRFWRADPSRARTVGGTGLGLAISLEDALLHGGWLEAWGRPQQGALLRLTLPREAGIALTGSPLPLSPGGAR